MQDDLPRFSAVVTSPLDGGEPTVTECSADIYPRPIRSNSLRFLKMKAGSAALAMVTRAASTRIPHGADADRPGLKVREATKAWPDSIVDHTPGKPEARSRPSAAPRSVSPRRRIEITPSIRVIAHHVRKLLRRDCPAVRAALGHRSAAFPDCEPHFT